MNLLEFISYTGTFVFALAGALKARTFHMDIFGGSVLAFVSAYGGGTLRDLLIGIRPVNWVNDNLALILVCSATAIVFLFKENVERFNVSLFFTDAIGIGLFTAAGIERSLQLHINEIYSLIMGVITATFGGLIADVLSNTIPNVLKRGELYATACVVGGGVYLLLKQIPIEYNTNLFICIVVVVAIRIISNRKRLTLPDL